MQLSFHVLVSWNRLSLFFCSETICYVKIKKKNKNKFCVIRIARSKACEAQVAGLIDMLQVLTPSFKHNRLKWENCHSEKLHSENCQYMCLGKDVVSNLLQFCGQDLKASELKIVLGIETDNKLNFESYLKTAVKYPEN